MKVKREIYVPVKFSKEEYEILEKLMSIYARDRSDMIRYSIKYLYNHDFRPCEK